MNRDRENQYLVPEAIRKARRSGRIRAAAGGFLFAFFALGYLGMFLDVGAAAVSDANNIAGTITVLMIIAVILTPCWLLFISGIRRLRYAGRAEKYAAVFAGDEDGYLLYTDAAERLGIPRERVDSDLRELLRRKYIKNVQQMDGDPGCILLTDGRGTRWSRACYLTEADVINEGVSSVLLLVVAGLCGVSILTVLPGLFMITVREQDSGSVFFLIYTLLCGVFFAWLWMRASGNRACLKRSGIRIRSMPEKERKISPCHKPKTVVVYTAMDG